MLALNAVPLRLGRGGTSTARRRGVRARAAEEDEAPPPPSEEAQPEPPLADSPDAPIGEAEGPPAEAEAPAPPAEAEEAEAAAAADEVSVEELAEEAVEEPLPPLTPVEEARAVISSVAGAVSARPLLQGALGAAALVLGGTLALAVYKVFLRFNSSRSKRKRLVGKNLVVVEALGKYLPGARGRLSAAVVRSLCARTGFSPNALFRKQLRYMLNERPFDGEVAADVLALRAACGLGEEELLEVLRDTAERTFKSTGILMRRPSGMTAEGLARKVQGRALFSKLLYLAEMEGLLSEPARPAAAAMLLSVFGATSEDAEALRIASLTELDSEALERMWAAGGREATEAEGEGEAAAAPQPPPPPPPPAAAQS